MLDQSDYISRYDQHGILKVITEQAAQLRHDYGPVKAPAAKTAQLVVAGMGGSALAGDFVAHWLADRLPVPVQVVRDYQLPDYVGPHTLVVVSSYSGNTEESLSCLEDAKRRKAQVVILTSGGKLKDAAGVDDLPLLLTPAGLQPRLAVLYGVRALAQLIETTGWVKGLVSELEAASQWLEARLTGWTADVATDQNSAKQIAQVLQGHPLVVYGGPTLALPAMKWKIDANENAKHLAFYDLLPEFDHNEFLGWGHPHPNDFRVIELQSPLDHPQIAKRFMASNELLKGQMPDPIIVVAEGSAKLEQILWTLILGDYTMAYLAFLNQVDPTPVPLIEQLKQQL